MVDAKSLFSPKVIFPVVGVCVLIVVGALVAVFYIRNPTVTDSLFTPADTTGSPDEERKVEAVTSGGSPASSYTGGSNNAGSYAIDSQTTHDPGHGGMGTTQEAKPLLPSSASSSSAAPTTPSAHSTVRPIEPVKHE